MAVKIVHVSAITISTPGTAQQLSNTGLACTSILVQADELNTGNIFLGGATVDSTAPKLGPGCSIPITADDINGTTDEFFLNDIWIDTETGGNVVRVVGFRRKI